MKFAHLILRNLGRNTRRTILTVFAIGLAVFTYTTLSGIPYLIKHIVSSPASARRIVTTNKSGFFYSLPEAYRRRIQAIPHVIGVSSIVYFGGRYRDPSDQLGVAIDADATDTLWPDWGVTPERAAMLKARRTACLVPPAMMRKYRWHVGDQIALKGMLYPVTTVLQIADTLSPGAPPDTLMFRRDYLDELLGRTGQVNAYYAIVDRESEMPSAIAAIDETFANSSAETVTASEANFISSYFDLSTLLLLLNGFAAIAIVAMSLVAVNTMAMAVRERRGETAVMRALGFTPSLVMSLALAESAAIGVGGGIVGCLTAYGFARLLPVSILALGPVDLFEILPAPVAARGIALAALIGVAAGTVSLASGGRRSIAESLRAIR